LYSDCYLYIFCLIFNATNLKGWRITASPFLYSKNYTKIKMIPRSKLEESDSRTCRRDSKKALESTHTFTAGPQAASTSLASTSTTAVIVCSQQRLKTISSWPIIRSKKVKKEASRSLYRIWRRIHTPRLRLVRIHPSRSRTSQARSTISYVAIRLF